MSYCLTSNNLGIKKEREMKEKKNVGLNFILSGWGWGGRLTQNLEKSKKNTKHIVNLQNLL